MHVIQSWKRFLTCGCSHGHLENRRVCNAVLKFKQKWKPHETDHLGDWADLAALRGKANAKDAIIDIKADLTAGLSFLAELEPTDVYIGNHDDRALNLLDHPSAIYQIAGEYLRAEVKKVITDKLHARMIPYDINEGWRRRGDTLFGHGYMFNEASIRDHAESVGRCVIAHLHRVGMEPGRVRNGAVGFCVGTLANIHAMVYAKTRRSRLRHNHGLAYGLFNDKRCMVWLLEIDADGNYQSPI